MLPEAGGMVQVAERTSLAALLAADARAWQRRGMAPQGANGLKLHLGLALRAPGYRATVLYRIGHWAQKRRIRGLPGVTMAVNTALHGIEISASIPIGPGFYLAHTVGSVVNPAIIGANVELQGGITLGTRTGGFPEIGDGVVVGCGARVLGPIVLGTGARVGANAVVLQSVAPGQTVVGIPARPMTRSAAESAGEAAG